MLFVRNFSLKFKFLNSEGFFPLLSIWSLSSHLECHDYPIQSTRDDLKIFLKKNKNKQTAEICGKDLFLGFFIRPLFWLFISRVSVCFSYV